MIENTKANNIIVSELSVQQMAQSKVKDGKKEKKTKQKKGQNIFTKDLENLDRFVQFLTYKAKLVGKSVIIIDEKQTTRNVVIVEKYMICLLGIGL
jgi:putative transposase